MKWDLTKQCAVFSLLVAMSISSHAEILLSFGGGSDATNTTFTFSNLDSTPTFDGGAIDDSITVSSNTISGLSGSFTVDVSATQSDASTDPFTWTYGAETAILQTGAGLGVESTGETGGARQLGPDEAILLTFDLSGLTINPGVDLRFRLFAATNDTFRVYERTGPNAGIRINNVNTNSARTGNMVINTNGLLQYAIADAGWNTGGRLRITGMNISTIPEPAAIGTIAGVGALALLIRRRLLS